MTLWGFGCSGRGGPFGADPGVSRLVFEGLRFRCAGVLCLLDLCRMAWRRTSGARVENGVCSRKSICFSPVRVLQKHCAPFRMESCMPHCCIMAVCYDPCCSPKCFPRNVVSR